MIDSLKKKENIVPFILILIFLLKLTFFPNYFNGGGDNPGYWKIITNQGDCTGDICWRFYRWTIIFYGKITNLLFESNYLSYFIISASITIFSLSLFMNFLKRNISIYYLLFFLIFWLFSIPIQSSTYDIGVVSFNILFLIIYLLLLEKFIKEKNSLNLFLLIIPAFFLYGVTIFNLIFFVHIFFIILLNRKYSLIKVYILFVLVLFSLESIVLNLIYDDNLEVGFSRLSRLLLGENSVLSHCNQGGCSNVDIASRYPDGGIFTRWFFQNYNHGFLFIITFFISLYHCFNKKISLKEKLNKINFNISLLFILFFVSLSLLLKPEFPPRALLSFADHYVSHFSIICLYLIFKAIDSIEDLNFTLRYLASGYFLIYVLLPSFGHMQNYKYIFFNTKYNIFTMDEFFSNKKIFLEKGIDGCMKVEDETVLWLFQDLINLKDLNKNLSENGLCGKNNNVSG